MAVGDLTGASVLFTTRGQGRFGTEKMVVASAVLPANYVAASGIPVPPTVFGLTSYATNQNSGAQIDPIVLNVAGAAGLKSLLARISAQVMRVFFPTGGAATAPSAAATDPVGLCGTGVATASAVDATRPTVGLTAGQGKEIKDATDLSGVTVTMLAFGH